MISKRQTRSTKVQQKAESLRPPEQTPIQQQEQGPEQAVAPQAAYRRAQLNNNGLMTADLLTLQRTVGNRQVQRILAQNTDGANGQQQGVPAEEKPGIKVQTKLTVGAPDDLYAQEADRVAQQVMRMPIQAHRLSTRFLTPTQSRLQRNSTEAFSEDEAKNVKQRWDTGSYTVKDTNNQVETKAYNLWKTKSNQVLQKLVKTVDKTKIDELKGWINKYEAHEQWTLRSQGSEPDKPGATPTELTNSEVKKGETLGDPPSPAYRKVQQYDVTLPSQQGSYTFQDNPVKPDYPYLVSETGVAKGGKNLKTVKMLIRSSRMQGLLTQLYKK
jgi:hypothetical protein